MKERNLKKNFIWNSIGSFTYFFALWLLTFLVVRISPNLSDAGNLSLALSITNIFFNLACFNLRPFLVSDNTNEYSSGDYVAFRFVTIIFSFILCLAYMLIFKYSGVQFVCIFLYLIFKMVEAGIDIMHALEQRKDRMDIGGISFFFRGVITVLSFYLGFKIFNNINSALLLMIITTTVFMLFYDIPKLRKIEKVKIRFKKEKIIKLFLALLPLAIGTVLSITSTALPRQILEKMNGSDMLGIYATIATPAVIVQMAATYIFNPLLTTFADLRKKNDKKGFVKLFNKVNLIILLLSVICCVGAYFLAEFGLNILFGEKISKHYMLFMPIIIYTSLNAFSWFFHNVLIVYRKIKVLIFVYLTAFLICLFGSKPFISKFGMNGVSYILIISVIVMIVEMLLIIYFSIIKNNRKNYLGE